MEKPARGEDKCAITEQVTLGFLEDVKHTFEDAPLKYKQFLHVIMEFSAHRIDTADVMKLVKALFQGHRHLILGFNKFLPPGYEIDVSSEEDKEFYGAIAYVNGVKDTFADDIDKYKEFLKVLEEYRMHQIDCFEVVEGVKLLFQGYPDLMLGFSNFLPPCEFTRKLKEDHQSFANVN